jgi:hypothetical protein
MSKAKLSKGKISKEKMSKMKNAEREKRRNNKKSGLMLIVKYLFDFNKKKRKIRVLQVINR